jgi:23S rRNA (guanine2535-N1)-methyltransferase
MQYKFEKTDQNYSDLASGKVFYSLLGHPAFPVRLASEIFQRCLANRRTIYGVTTPCTLYDPCCGAAYHLSVIGYLHRNNIQKIIGSDVDEKAVDLAKLNLGLLSEEGINRRIDEITSMLEQYKKASHKEALQSALVIKNKVTVMVQEHPLVTRAFQANAMDGRKMLSNIPASSVDIVFTDIPYGQHSQWHVSDIGESTNPIGSMLNALTGVISTSGIVAIVSDKRQKVSHDKYQRVEQFQIGKRLVNLLKRG